MFLTLALTLSANPGPTFQTKVLDSLTLSAAALTLRRVLDRLSGHVPSSIADKSSFKISSSSFGLPLTLFFRRLQRAFTPPTASAVQLIETFVAHLSQDHPHAAHNRLSTIAQLFLQRANTHMRTRNDTYTHTH